MRWIEQWAERRRLKQRALFKYHDGSRVRYADPAVVWRRLLDHPKLDFGTMIGPANAGHEPERTILMDALCDIFAVQPWDEATRHGLLEWELLDLVRQFDEYLAALKKNTSPSQMPWQLSAYEPSATPALTPAETPGGPTNSTADSSSSPTASNTAADTPSCEPLPTA